MTLQSPSIERTLGVDRFQAMEHASMAQALSEWETTPVPLPASSSARCAVKLKVIADPRTHRRVDGLSAPSSQHLLKGHQRHHQRKAGLQEAISSLEAFEEELVLRGGKEGGSSVIHFDSLKKSAASARTPSICLKRSSTWSGQQIKPIRGFRAAPVRTNSTSAWPSFAG